MLPKSDTQDPLPIEPVDWENWFNTQMPDDLSSLNDNPFVIQPDALEALDTQIELAQTEMNTPDGSRRLDELLEERDLLAEELAHETQLETVLEVVDARFLSRADVNTDGTVTGYTVQYMELYRDSDDAVNGRVLDIGRYDDQNHAAKVYDMIQESITDGSLTPEDFPILATELARMNDLPDDDWRTATIDDHQRFIAQNPPVGYRDIPPNEVVSDPVFTTTLFQATTADPTWASQEQSRLATEQALAALTGIGLSVQTDLDLSRDSFYDAERNERLVNGIFQQDPTDPTQNCRPMLISLTPTDNGMGFAAQAVEFGATGSLRDVQADHDRVQTALEQGGVHAGITAVDAIETELSAPDIQKPSLELS